MNKITLFTIGGLLVGGLVGYGLATNSSSLHSSDHELIDQIDDQATERHDNHAMHQMMGDMTTNLSGKTGDEFDKVFLEEMIIHHQGAVDMAELVLENSDRVELRQLAEDIIKLQKAEIDTMQNWLTSWY